MTCSPDQATFTNAAKVTEDYVEELDYAVSLEYAQGMYDSCKDVSNPTTGLSFDWISQKLTLIKKGAKALDLMCGNWETGCNATNWLTFLTDKKLNNMVPFQINVKTDIEGTDMTELMSDTVVSCNETAPGMRFW